MVERLVGMLRVERRKGVSETPGLPLAYIPIGDTSYTEDICFSLKGIQRIGGS